MFPGTPDGMFEEWDGSLTCVQVVRVPLTPTMTREQQEATIYRTVLEKIIKSQQWMKSTRTLPHEFVIFCWCQGWPETAGDMAQELIERVRRSGWPFVLKLMVPTDPGALFPVKFAYQRAGREGGQYSRLSGRKAKYMEEDLSTFVPDDFLSDEEEFEFEFSLFDDKSEFGAECEMDAIEAFAAKSKSTGQACPACTLCDENASIAVGGSTDDGSPDGCSTDGGSTDSLRTQCPLTA